MPGAEFALATEFGAGVCAGGTGIESASDMEGRASSFCVERASLGREFEASCMRLASAELSCLYQEFTSWLMLFS